MYYAIKIETKNDSNGNPRRGWLVYDTKGKLEGFARDQFSGDSALRSASHRLTGRSDQIITLAVIGTTISHYNTALTHTAL